MGQRAAPKEPSIAAKDAAMVFGASGGSGLPAAAAATMRSGCEEGWRAHTLPFTRPF